MAKVALLIGVSEYGTGLTGLPGTEADLKAMQQVLQNPQVCNFEAVEALLNPDPTQMLRAIETLFTENRNRDDLVLLYFTGHGVRDDNGTLYFATRITEKNPQGRIRTSTAVPAARLQEYMSQSRSKRQVLILDCCFSGAFANDMKAKAVDAAIDVKTQLGGEGRAVLTSSTATQVSYEKEGASIYTRYLVQGLATGAADRDGNGEITIDELHEYAKEKVQEAAPSMQPEIYLVREGYRIVIARAPQDDPKLIFRKEFDKRAKQKQGKISLVEQLALEYRWQELGLSHQEAEQIEREVLQPYQEYWAKLEKFAQAIKKTLDYESKLSATSIDDLRYLQQILKLRDEDITPILQDYKILQAYKRRHPTFAKRSANQISSHSQEEFLTIILLTLRLARLGYNPYKILPILSRSTSTESTSAKARFESITPVSTGNPVRAGLADASAQPPAPSSNPTPTDDLSSEKGIDYTRLRDLLKAGKWREADRETAERMCEAMRRQEEGWLRIEDVKAFPCVDLRTIDQLWVKYSNGHFGFSVQKKIWLDYGSPTDPDNNWDLFCIEVGWQNSQTMEYLEYKELKFDIEGSPLAELPLLGSETWGTGCVICIDLFSRAKACEL